LINNSTIGQSITQSINQSINQSNSQLVSQSINRTIRQSKILQQRTITLCVTPYFSDCTVCSRLIVERHGGVFTVESFGEEQHADAEEDEQIDNLLAMILDVVSNVFHEHRPSRRQLERRLSRAAERVVTRVETAPQTSGYSTGSVRPHRSRRGDQSKSHSTDSVLMASMCTNLIHSYVGPCEFSRSCTAHAGVQLADTDRPRYISSNKPHLV